MSKGPGLLASLKHRDFALLMGALVTSSIGDWAYNVAVAVWIFDETKSAAWIGAATVFRFVPALIFGPYGGVVAERFERVRLLVLLDFYSLIVMCALALEMALGHSAALVIALASLNGLHGSMSEPASAAMTPQLVGERDLGSANSLRNTIDSVCVIAGPGVGGLLLLVGRPWVAVAVNALTYLASAMLTARIRARSKPIDVTEGGNVGPVGQMLVGARTIASSGSAAVLVGFSLLVTVVFGIDTVQFVLISRDRLGTGAGGYGYLLAGLGIGGVLMGGLVVRLERLPRLTWIILISLAGYCVPTLLFLFVHQPVGGFVIEIVRGASTLIVDVLSITALQRTLSSDVLARVFGVFNTLILLAVAVGGAITAPIVHVVHLDGSIWFAGLVIPLLGLLGLPALLRMDRISVARRAELAPIRALIELCDIFASVSDGGVDALAAAAEPVMVEAGDVIVRQGDPADAFFVIAEGTFGVAVSEGPRALTGLLDMAAPDYFGEIGLIERIPRTATVTAKTAGRLLKIDGQTFVGALTESAPSPALLAGAASRLGRTNPSTQLTRVALAGESG